MTSLTELREKVQAPVRRYNDVAGLVYGDRVSIHVTRFFVRFNLSPTIATLAFLVFGLAGSVLLLFGGVYSVLGFACLFVYYIMDCVDGEVARYHGREKFVFGFHDFMFHLYVKSAFFICFGIYAARTAGEPWVFFFALAALVSTLMAKFLHDVSLILTCRYVLLRSPAERDRYVTQILAGAQGGMSTPHTTEPTVPPGQQFSGPLAFLRTALTNFDVAILLFLAAATIDMFVQPFRIANIAGDAKIAVLIFYGIVITFDFFDRLHSHLRHKTFFKDAADVLRAADEFRIRR